MDRARATGLALLLLGLAASGCGRGAETPREAAGEQAYAPGLGEIMSANQMRHVKLWYAGAARNWPLADYEIDELEEGFADAVRFHPTHKDAPRPLTELVPEFTAGPLQALRKAVRDASPSEFETAYDDLTSGCNGCHEAASFGFNVVVRPTANPYTDQRFAPEDETR
ncbi:MAG TPA: hypothetical protein VMW35_11270 [Myxococcota bacterium]|jgi:hypothetical protein|nr:hypothetical protein [Myxococcota bacterium]